MMALDYNWLRQQADEAGFGHTARLNARTIHLRDVFVDMLAFPGGEEE